MTRDRVILVTGSTGAIGRVIMPRLAEALATGDRPVKVALAVRDASRARRLLDRRLLDRVDLVTADLTREADVARLGDLPMEAVLHMAAVAREAGSERCWEGNVQATSHLLALARAARVGHFVFFGTDLIQRFPWGSYVRSQQEAEQRLVRSGVPFTILRPALVMHRRLPGVRSGWQSLVDACAWPLLPVFEGGRLRLKPLWANDLAAIVARCLEVGPRNDAYDLAGAAVSVADIGSMIARARGSRLHTVEVPSLLSRPAFDALALVTRVADRTVPPLMELGCERPAPPFGVHSWIGFQPTPFVAALEKVLGAQG